MNRKTCTLMLGGWVMALSVLAAPGLISYQGRLMDDTNKPVTTPVDVTFTFWNDGNNGTQLGSGFSDMDTVT